MKLITLNHHAHHYLRTNTFQCKPTTSFSVLASQLNSFLANCRIYSLTLHCFTRRYQSPTKSSTMDFQPSRVGYGFHPTDEELVSYYLRLKMHGGYEQAVSIIAEVNMCDFEPWVLPGTCSCFKSLSCSFFLASVN